MTKKIAKKTKTKKYNKSTSKTDVYELVTNRIIEELEKGVIPWRKPWVNGVAVNWLTQKPYSGINSMLLAPGEYATFLQISDAGGRIKKGEKGQIVVKWIEFKKDESNEEVEGEEGESKRKGCLKHYKVFNVLTQAEGIETKRTEQSFEHDPIEEAEAIYKNFMNCPSYSFNSGRATYSPSRDHINVPPMKDFPNIHEYYSTLFHEMVHSTGHTSRLARPGVTRSAVAFGDEVYSKEELVAEVGAAMLCSVAGIDNHTIENSASYLQSWLRALKEDKKLIVQASAQAQRAANYIQNIKKS
jgi:antirestriction protein ArdC